MNFTRACLIYIDVKLDHFSHIMQRQNFYYILGTTDLVPQRQKKMKQESFSDIE